jgi:hypothetical protein
MTYAKSMVNAIQNEQFGFIIYGDTAIDKPEELHVDCRDFSPESNCKEISRYLII